MSLTSVDRINVKAKNNIKGNIVLDSKADFLLKEKQVFPHPQVFERGSLTLYLVGRKEEAHELLDEGISLYPNYNNLLTLRQKFRSADAGDRSIN